MPMTAWRPWSRVLLIISLLSVVAFLPLFVTSQVPAQELPKLETTPYSLEVNVDLVLLNVTVVDDKGAYVPGLSKDDFAIYEDNEQQEISNFLPVEAPFHLVMLLDNSISTKESLGIIKKAAVNFTTEMRPEDRIAFVEINYFVQLFCNFTSDRKILRQQIAKLSTYPYGGSKIYDGIARGNDELKKIGPGRKALVLLSDNMENSSVRSFEDLRQMMAQNDVVLYSVTILNKEGQKKNLETFIKNAKADEAYVSNAKASLSVLEEIYALQNERMLTLADESGGRVMQVNDLSELEGEYSKVAGELRHTYSLAYYSKNHWRDGSLRKIRVQMKNPQLQARTRTSYLVPQD
jgi:VWFA-related protein